MQGVQRQGENGRVGADWIIVDLPCRSPGDAASHVEIATRRPNRRSLLIPLPEI